MSTTIEHIADQDTASRALNKVRNELDAALDNLAGVSAELRELIVAIRPKGLLTVDAMAEAVARDRNYIDSVWSNHGDTSRGKQTRVAVTADASDFAVSEAYDALHAAADATRKHTGLVQVARAERDRTVALVYGSKILGPSDIAREVGIDRNHCLRISRKAGIAPVHRAGTRNQYSAKDAS